MTPRQDPISTARARKLRRDQTQTESLLWYVLRRRRYGLKFRRQFPIECYIVDFACVEHKLIVELDGPYHEYVYENDQSRQLHLESMGWRVLRFVNNDVLNDAEAVAKAIIRQVVGRTNVTKA